MDLPLILLCVLVKPEMLLIFYDFRKLGRNLKVLTEFSIKLLAPPPPA